MCVGRFEPAEQEARMNNTIATQVRELQHLAADQLTQRYTALFGKPPRIRNAAGCAGRSGGSCRSANSAASANAPGLASTSWSHASTCLSAPRNRLGRDLTHNRPAPSRRRHSSARPWCVSGHGQKIQVEVAEGSYVWNGTPFRSLSAVAKAITGTTWNGRLFFGLTERRWATQ